MKVGFWVKNGGGVKKEAKNEVFFNQTRNTSKKNEIFEEKCTTFYKKVTVF